MRVFFDSSAFTKRYVLEEGTDIADAAICDLTPEVIRHSIIALENNVLRGMDAIHLGSALALNVDIFVSADARQCAAAAQAGLTVVQV
jgi:predicted nucleic acid-binding protein